jgi:hypothetical protein
MPIEVRCTCKLGDDISLLYRSCPPTLLVNENLWRIALPAERLHELTSLWSGLAPYIEDIRTTPLLVAGKVMSLSQLAERDAPWRGQPAPDGRLRRPSVGQMRRLPADRGARPRETLVECPT